VLAPVEKQMDELKRENENLKKEVAQLRKKHADR
jgi:cell division protein FtsB